MVRSNVITLEPSLFPSVSQKKRISILYFLPKANAFKGLHSLPFHCLAFMGIALSKFPKSFHTHNPWQTFRIDYFSTCNDSAAG